MDTIIQDVRYGIRMLLKAPGFTFIAVLTMALGIGANTTVFSLANAALLKPLPFPHSERLMMLFHSYPELQLPRATVSPLRWDYYLNNVQSLEALAAFAEFGAPQNLTTGGSPERVHTIAATHRFFDVLGMRAMRGRTFVLSDDQPGTGRVAVLGYGLWKARFGGNEGILGKDITLDGKNYSVIGIMPPGFEFPQQAQLWVPTAFTPEKLKDGVEYLSVIGRIREGLTAADVSAEMNKITADIRRMDGMSEVGTQWSITADPLRDVVVGRFRAAIWILLAAVMFVLLIGCANIANLLLARATARNKELSIRSALGASRMRVVRQLLTEGILLALCGGILGLLLGVWGVDLLLGVIPVDLPAFIHVGVDIRVLLFTFLASMFAGLLFGSVPAWQVSATALNETLKEGGRTMNSDRQSTRRILVISEVALAMMLLVSAGLMIRSFSRILHSNPGFNAQNALTADIVLPAAKYKDPSQLVSFYRELDSRIAALPGVTVSGAVSTLPLESGWQNSFEIQGKKDLSPRPHTHAAVIIGNYFQALQIPLISGRLLSPSDTPESAPVVVIDENAKRAFWPNEDPIGKQLALSGEGKEDKPSWRTIVGVVGSVKHDSLLVNETKGQLYVPQTQFPVPWMNLVVRTTQNPMALATAIRNQVKEIDPEQPVFKIRSMQAVLDESVAQPKFNTLLLVLFAGLALVLAAVGIYGVMSYSVTQRTHEIGVRMALGAQQSDVLKMVVSHAMWLAGVGVLAGVVGSLLATRLLSGLLFEVRPTDPLTFLAITVLLSTIALVAGLIPARRATRVDPVVALRYE